MSRLHMGIDVGSTTVKVVVLDENNNTLFAEYRRHFSDIKSTVKGLFAEVKEVVKNEQFTVVITGSGGLLLSKMLDLPFVQEVIANKTAIKTFMPETDVVIELGGEDAKILYLSGGLEQRMNGTCAGGTGSFIDQMSILLKTDADGLNALAENHTIIYPIAARCGVFAKSDVQPLLNEGAAREDIAASILQAVVTQTISGLATSLLCLSKNSLRSSSVSNSLRIRVISASTDFAFASCEISVSMSEVLSSYISAAPIATNSCAFSGVLKDFALSFKVSSN